MSREDDVRIPISILQNYTTSLTPVDFEKLVRDCMQELGTGLTELHITHNEKIPVEDGTYQIDVYATFKAMGVTMKVVAECKQYKSSVTREKVVVLHDKLRALGAHKGIMFSTAGYQEGAIRYAIVHGIALVRILPREAQFLTNYVGRPTFDFQQYIDAPDLIAECTFDGNYSILKGKDVHGLERYLLGPIIIS